MRSSTLGRTTLDQVHASIRDYFETGERQGATYSAEHEQLWQIARQCSTGGKLIRPRLFLAAYDSMRAPTAPLAPHVVDLAAAIELLHFAFLLHDDVIDGDQQRRGEPNLIGALLATIPEPQNRSATARTLRWANSSAILMGNILLAEVHQRFARTQVNSETRERLLNLLARAIADSVAGEHLDVGLETGIIPSDMALVLDMTRLKTATYTFDLPLRAAAILASDESDEPSSPLFEETLSTAARHLGLAFQLQDDLLSTFGDPDAHGKDCLSDLREGKETALIAYARTTAHWPGMARLFGRPGNQVADLEWLRDQLRACGAEAYVLGLVRTELEHLYALTSDPSRLQQANVAQVVLDLTERLVGRQL